MAEGRKSFLELVLRIEDGGRCEDLQARHALAALRSGAGLNGGREELRGHLRSCARCRAKARSRA